MQASLLESAGPGVFQVGSLGSEGQSLHPEGNPGRNRFVLANRPIPEAEVAKHISFSCCGSTGFQYEIP